MKKFSASLILLISLGLGLTCRNTIQAQSPVVIYDQDFDSVMASPPTSSPLPSGWTKTFNGALVNDTTGWHVDTANSSLGYPGASGNQHVVIKNLEANGVYELITNTISTTSDSAIHVQWGLRNSNKFFGNGGYISFWYSPDNGSTWDSVPYTEAAANSAVWAVDTPGTLSAAANKNAGIKFKWKATVTETTASGTYRLDDFVVSGLRVAVSTGVNDVVVPATHAFMMDNNTLEVSGYEMTDSKYTVELYNILGERVKAGNITSSPYLVDMSALQSGVYLVKVNNGSTSQVTKVVKSR